MDNKAKKFNWDYVLVASVYAAILIFLFHTINLTKADSKVFPYIVLGICTFLNTMLLIKTILTPIDPDAPELFVGGKRAMLITICILVYMIVIVFAGFYVATPIYLYVTMHLFGQRNKKVMILVSVICTVFVLVVFELIMKLPIPKGMLFK